ncbi:hypothetical protein HF521_011637 [Silurus meridionalis]|uniref:Uncharacterized protein n=1 Tax=Silurus meridionalis TaxID=175797 RepID=A0A8T0AII6_SILME|nr:hypothetical protein HF521_011637 [Silurus meridionalis]
MSNSREGEEKREEKRREEKRREEKRREEKQLKLQGAWKLKVTCGWARGCNTGHGSCLSLLLVSCVAASGTAALCTSEGRPPQSKLQLSFLLHSVCRNIAQS